jgi:hypothetical protein
MADHAENVPPLFVEQTLENVANFRFVRDDYIEEGSRDLQYPAQLGALAVDALRFEPYSDAERIAGGVEADFRYSYEMDDAEAASGVRQRSMAWLDWLSRDTKLRVNQVAYLELAGIAAEQGDAETVRQIIEDPKRLWLENRAGRTGTDVNDPAFGQLNKLSTTSMGIKIHRVAALMAVAPAERAEDVQAVVMPVFSNIVTEFVSRDITAKAVPVGRTVSHLLNVGNPEAMEQLNRLVDATPMTSARLDLLVSLARIDQHFAAAANEALGWHNDKASLAESVLAQHLKPGQPGGTGRNTIDYPINGGTKSIGGSRKIAAAIVDHIPDGSETSAIETSVAYITNTENRNSLHGNILGYVRTLTNNPQLELADPQFGFSAGFEDGGLGYPDGKVTIVDANLPDGRIVIDLSAEPFKFGEAYDEAHLLCRIIQREKNRRVEE